MDVQIIYAQLKDAGLVRSQAQFSQVWLGRSPRYYSYLVATGRQPGLATMIALHIRLARVAAIGNAAGRSMIGDLSANLHGHIERRAIVDIRHRTRR